MVNLFDETRCEREFYEYSFLQNFLLDTIIPKGISIEIENWASLLLRKREMYIFHVHRMYLH